MSLLGAEAFGGRLVVVVGRIDHSLYHSEHASSVLSFLSLFRIQTMADGSCFILVRYNYHPVQLAYRVVVCYLSYVW